MEQAHKERNGYYVDGKDRLWKWIRVITEKSNRDLLYIWESNNSDKVMIELKGSEDIYSLIEHHISKFDR